MDMRIIKTKKNIKESLIRLLGRESFEKITVSEICREGITSRITFYTYYRDKYALLNEMLKDYYDEVGEIYQKIKAQVMPENDGPALYDILLESILHLYYDHYAFFSHTASSENPYLFSALYNRALAGMNAFILRHHGNAEDGFVRQATALLCGGLFGVIHSCVSEKMNESQARSVVGSMFKSLLSSPLFASEASAAGTPPMID